MDIGYVSNVSIDNIGSEDLSMRGDFFGGEHVRPAFSNETPANTSLITNQTLLISINITDMGISINTSTVS